MTSTDWLFCKRKPRTIPSVGDKLKPGALNTLLGSTHSRLKTFGESINQKPMSVVKLSGNSKFSMCRTSVKMKGENKSPMCSSSKKMYIYIEICTFPRQSLCTNI